MTYRRDRLAARPLAELHAMASELGIPRFRLLRKSELADAILARRAIENDRVVQSGLRVSSRHRLKSSRRRRGFGLHGS